MRRMVSGIVALALMLATAGAERAWAAKLAWGTYLGGGKIEYSRAVCTDQDGNIYLTGYSMSPNWASGGGDTTLNGSMDAFVMKLAPTGTPLWSAYLGGEGLEVGTGIAVDAAGALYVCGRTQSAGWLSGAFDSSYNASGGYDGFLVKLSSAGQAVWGAYLGGENDDEANGLALDGAGNICVVGETYSEGWLTGGYDPVYDDAQDAYALKVSPAGALLWGTYLGGGKLELGNGIAVDGADNIYVAGDTQSAGWIAGGFRTAYSAQGSDGFVVKLTPQGARAWSTYLSGSQATAAALAIDHGGNVCVTGYTSAAGWTAGGQDDTYGGGSRDGYLEKLSGAGQLLWSEYFGGNDYETPRAIAIDANDQITIAGTTGSTDWIWGGFDTTLGNIKGGGDAFALRLAPDGRYLCGSYLGATAYDEGIGVVALGPASVLVTGSTGSANWLNSPGLDTTLGGTGDAFLVRIDEWDQVSAGALCVTITPPAAVAAGAQWRRAGTTAWHDSGTTEPGVPYGHYALEFKTLPDWARPAAPLAADVATSKSTLAAAYVPGGVLKVTIEPAEARAAGAQWRVFGTNQWRDSDTTVSEAAGFISIEFAAMPNWTTPPLQSFLLNPGQTTSTVGLYELARGELAWGSYLGGSGSECANDVALDPAGNVYLTGSTTSSGWVSGGADDAFHAGTDAFVVKLSSKGQHLWSAYLGGANNESGAGIALDRDGAACIVGLTDSSGWLTGGQDPSYSGAQDGFALKLDAAGKLRWGTYLGGNYADSCTDVTADEWGYFYVAGQTASGGWLTTFYGSSYNSFADGFVLKLAPQGDKVWGRYVGGSGSDSAQALVIDPAFDALYVVGSTTSGGWEQGTDDPAHYGGGSDAFLARMTLYGDLSWCGLYGGVGNDYGSGVAVGKGGNVHICGRTDAAGWIWGRGGYDASYGGMGDGFVVTVSTRGKALWSTYLGGEETDQAYDIATDAAGSVFVAGSTSSQYWTRGGFDAGLNAGHYGASSDAFIVKLSSAGLHLWSSCLGGTYQDEGRALAVGDAGALYVAGFSQSTNWLSGGYSTQPVTALQSTDSAFVAQVRDITQPGRGALRVTLAPDTLGVQWRRIGQTLWRKSDDTEYNVPAGAQDVEFYAPASSIAALPQPITLTVADGRTTTATVPLTVLGCAVTVNITPPEAVAQGARWRILNSKAWQASGAVLGGLAVTTPTISFSDVPGMTTPAGLKLPLQLGQTTSATVRYLYPGSLCVKITPPEAAAAGAQWRIKGLLEWHDSGTTASVPLGAQTVEFKDMVGWVRPADASVNIATGAVASASGAYVRQYGALQVFLTPAAAVTAGAQWRRAGTTAWLNSGVRENIVEAGPVGIEFKPVAQWARPQVTTVTVSQAYLTQHTGAYTASRLGLNWSTYLGGGQSDTCEGVAAGPGGTLYVTGTTSSTGWITGGYSGAHHGATDAFVTRLDANGQPLWSAYLGGDKDDSAYSLAVDGAGEVCITGETYSSGWVSGGFDTNYRGARDAYVVKLSATGRHRWSALLGDTGEDRPRDIAIDGGSGAVCVTGYTNSHGWLIGGPDSAQRKFESAKRGVNDVFVAKLSAEGQRLWTTDLGGVADDYGYGIAVDGAGNLYVTGRTASGGWLARGINTTLSGGDDAFVLKLSPGGVMLWGTYLGGAGDDIGSEIAVDALGNVWAAGETKSAGWVSGGYQTAFGGPPWDGWLARLTTDGRPVWSTYVGGASHDECLALAVDGAGAAYVTGDTKSTSWTMSDLDDSLNNGSGSSLDAYAVKVSPGGRLVWSTFLGGGATEVGNDIAVNGAGKVYVAGRTQSSGWVAGGSDLSYGGSQDGFVAQLQDQSAADPTGALRVTLTGAGGGGQWRRAGAATWRSSGATESGVPAGVWAIELKPVAGWAAAPGAPVSVAAGQTANASGGYVQASTLQVTITPAAAAQEGARWRRAGTVPWLASGAREELPAGDYTVEYKPAPFWVAPTSQTLTLAAGASASLTGQYAPVDQALSWSTYVGGLSGDMVYDCAVDGAGAIYVAGFTYGGGWASGGYDTTYGGSDDGFLAKLSPAGAHLWSTYLGGASVDYLNGVAVDKAGNVCAVGVTYSDGWITGGYDTTRAGVMDGFAAKFSPGGQLLWSTYLGGSDSDQACGVASDAANNLYVCGATRSNDWISGGAYTSYTGSYDGFVLKLSPEGQRVWSSYIGGGMDEQALKVAVDSAGDVCVAGYLMYSTTSKSLWLKSGFDTSLNGYNDGFIVKFSAGGACLWGACMGGDGDDQCTDIAVDGNRNIIVTGQTMSPDWCWGNDDSNYEGGDYDGFVLKVSPTGQRLWGSYLGGRDIDTATAVATDGVGNVFVVGDTQSDDGWIAGGFAPEPGDVRFDRNDGFILKFAPGGRRLWSSYLGGSAWDSAQGVAVDASGNLAVTGYTRSTDWIGGGYDTLYGGGSGRSGGDVFVAKIAQKINLRVTLTPSAAAAAGAQWRRVGTTQWRASGETESGIAEGTACEIEFKPAPNWLPPAHAWATVGVGVTDVTAVYEQCGSLAVTITPPAAVAAGAQWRRKGTSLWLASGATDAQAPLGACTVEFTDLTAKYWLAPLPAAATVQAGKTTSLAAAYAPRLLVSAVTPLAVPAALGQRVTLTAAAVGAAPLTFQWTKNGVPIAGATGLSLTLAACQLADEGAYACVARNPYAQASSPEFRVTVHNGSGVIAYLLGQTANAAGLDLNGDGQVTIADALKGVRTTPPATPSGPSPGSGATGLGIKPRLDWADSVDAASYDLYVWKSSASRPAAPTASGLRASQYDVSAALAYGTTYKWQVIARRPEGAATASGPVWSFTTAKTPAGAPKAAQAGAPK